MLVAENNEPFSICDGFSKIGGDMSPNSELAKKYRAGKTKTIEITKNKGNHCRFLKKQI